MCVYLHLQALYATEVLSWFKFELMGLLFCWFQEEQKKKEKGLVCKVTLLPHTLTLFMLPHIDFSTQNGMLTACSCNFQTLLFIILDVNQLEKVPQVLLFLFGLFLFV